MLSYLLTARENFAKLLRDMSENPKPTYSLDGESYSWVEYQRFLLDALERTNEAIQREQGPYTIATRMRSG